MKIDLVFSIDNCKISEIATHQLQTNQANYQQRTIKVLLRNLMPIIITLIEADKFPSWERKVEKE